MPKNKLSAIEVERFKEIMANPVMWARAFIRTFNPKTKKHEPWVARWYQAEILLDESVKKVARCGRRTGKHLLFICELLEGPTPLEESAAMSYRNRKGSETTSANVFIQHERGYAT